MEWLLTNTQIHSTFASLGSVQGDNYVPSEDCLEILDEINYKLEIEDQTLRSFRRAIGFGQNVRNDIIPLLVNVKDPRIIESTIRILVNLTIPVECLMPVDTMLASDMGRHTVFELNKLLIHVKEAFTDSKTTKSVLEYMKVLLDSEDNGEPKRGTKNCGEINNCLLLLRNILNIPEHLHKNYFNLPKTSVQNQILWNLFTQSVDRILLQVMTCPERSHWCVTLVQLIALIYKDQHVNTLQKLLNICVESSISDTSEDNESNTSPAKQSNSDSPMLTSDPTTSDSSDNGGTGQNRASEERRSSEISSSRNEEDEFSLSGEKFKEEDEEEKEEQEQGDEEKIVSGDRSPSMSANPGPTATPKLGKRRLVLSSTSELSDCGYGTQVENPESISTSSTEDYAKPPIHQKPPANQKQRLNSVNNPRKVLTVVERSEWRRKKLAKRSRSTMINMKGMINHTPTDDDITNILKEFTVDFLLKGYGLLVEDLHEQLMTDVQLTPRIDTSHFFWLVTYFLKFAGQLELDLGHVHTIFTFDIVGYSVYEAVSICEQLDIAGFDLVPSLRRLHLSVTAIREFLQAIETYKKISHLRDVDMRYLLQLECQIASSQDLRNLFVLLLRKFNPSIQSKQYLQDVIVTNHQLLMLLDQVSRRKELEQENSFSIDEHIREFASVDILHWFGYLLEEFHENGDFVNDCIFTMMHHVAGDVGQVSILFQPIILKAFSKIWDTEFVMCDDWSDLVEYVINKFISSPQSPQREMGILGAGTNYSQIKTEVDSGQDEHPKITTWSEEETDTLNWYFAQATTVKDDPIEEISRQFKENGHREKSHQQIVDQLLSLGLVTEEEPVVAKYKRYSAEQALMPNEKQDLTHSTKDDVEFLAEKLLEEHPKMIIWLQRVLLQCSFIKSRIDDGVRTNQELIVNLEGKHMDRIMEPTLLIYILKKQSVPLIPWTSGQMVASTNQPFVLLLHKLGFHLGADTKKLFARIPEFWTADHLYMVANRLGPVSPQHFQYLESVLNSEGYPGDSGATTTRRTSAYSGASLITWTDSPVMVAMAGKGAKKAVPVVDASNNSGTTEYSKGALRSKSLSLHSQESIGEEEGLKKEPEAEIKARCLADPKVFVRSLVAVDSTSVWETVSQVSSVPGMCVSDEET